MVGALGHGRAVDLISIADQVTWSFTRGKCLCDLTRDPLCGRTRCYVDPDKISAGKPDHDEDVEQLESDAWNHEQTMAAICVERLRRKVSHPCEGEVAT